jgi:DNA (cytosine-5)-methyltransferase 1
MLRLQGFPDSYKIVVPYNQLRKQAGNAVPVNLIQSVFDPMVDVLINDIPSNKKNLTIRERKNAYKVAQATNCR